MKRALNFVSSVILAGFVRDVVTEASEFMTFSTITVKEGNEDRQIALALPAGPFYRKKRKV